MLTTELLVLNEDLNKTKSDLKQKTEALKKSEKERESLKKQCETL